MNSLFSPAGARVLRVAELTQSMKEVLDVQFSAVWVEGEISNFKKHSSGHWYFSLKDSEATIAAVLFRGINLRLRFDPHDGLKVVAHGRVEVYAPRGQYPLVVDRILPRGLGELELAYRQI